MTVCAVDGAAFVACGLGGVLGGGFLLLVLAGLVFRISCCAARLFVSTALVAGCVVVALADGVGRGGLPGCPYCCGDMGVAEVDRDVGRGGGVVVADPASVVES